MIVFPLLVILLVYFKGAEWATSVVRQFFPFTLGIITQQNWYFPYVAMFLLGMFLIYEYRKRSKKEAEGRKKVWEMREAVKQNITTEPSFFTYDPEIPGVSLTAIPQYKKETRTNSQEEKEYDDIFLQAFKQALLEGIRQGKIQVEINAEIPLPKDALSKGSKGMIRVSSSNASQQQTESHIDKESSRSPVEILKEAEGEEEA